MRHISEISFESLEPQKTALDMPFVDELFQGGLMHGVICTFAALPASGKSFLLDAIRRKVLEKQWAVLAVELEMSVAEVFMRNKVDPKSLYEYPYFFIETATQDTFKNLDVFIKAQYPTPVLITIDHPRLITSSYGDDRALIEQFYNTLVELKRTNPGQVTFLVAYHLNRGISMRAYHQSEQYPTPNDLFNSSTPHTHSDFLFAMVKPHGLVHTSQYGPDSLPLTTKDSEPLIYIHTLKNRFGNQRPITSFTISSIINDNET